MGKQLLQSERNAGLFIEALPSLVAEHKFKLHDFVVMPDHVHLLIDVAGEMTIEKAMQFVKGRNHQSLDAHRAYIGENPAKAGLARSAEEYPFSFSVFGAQEKRS